MIDRYKREEMARLWSDEARFKKMLEVEIAAVEAMVAQKKVPKADLNTIKKKAKIDAKEIAKIEKVVKHDVIAFLTQVEKSIGKAGRHMHHGLTSSDVLDTATALQMVDATNLLEEGLLELIQTVKTLAKKHKNTLMAGRSHGVHAEPTTFGLKVLGWLSELKRGEERLSRAMMISRYGKISGAVGTYAHVDPQFEGIVMKRLKLNGEPVSTQIVPRDRHAEYLSILALISAGLERIATEIRHLQRTEVLEAEEPFTEGQKGSSAMPHKRNPIGSENICGLSRLMRSYAHASLENIALWHERDISHSSVERVVLPDATILLDFMIHRMNGILKGLVVYPDRMKENMKKTLMILASQRLMLKLIEKGGKRFSREEAYRTVQKCAQRAWTQKDDFKMLVLRDDEISKYLDPVMIQECFNPSYFIRHVDKIYKRFNLN